MTADQHATCSCHRDCTTNPRACDAPCRWPACTGNERDAEHDRALCARLERVFGGPRPANEARA